MYIHDFSQEEYGEEGLDVASIPFRDNQKIIDLIAKRPAGLMPILEDQARYSLCVAEIDCSNAPLRTCTCACNCSRNPYSRSFCRTLMVVQPPVQRFQTSGCLHLCCGASRVPPMYAYNCTYLTPPTKTTGGNNSSLHLARMHALSRAMDSVLIVMLARPPTTAF